MLRTLRMIYGILVREERRAGLVLLALMIVGMLLEMLGVGILLPVLSVMVQDDIVLRYPALQPAFERLGSPTQRQLIIGALLGLVVVLLFKNAYIAFLGWRQQRFGVDVSTQLSQRLFTAYLRQPWTFHLQRNSSQLIRNVLGEAGMFTSVLSGVLLLTSEGLVLLGVGAMLLMVEPVGALLVAVVLGGASWGFQRLTRSHILRWGELRQYHSGLSTQHLIQGLGGAKDVKLLGREGEFLRQFQLHHREAALAVGHQNTVLALPRLWLEVLAAAGLATLVMTMLARGETMGSIVPTVGLFAAAAFRLLPSAGRILSSIETVRFGLPAVSVLHEEKEFMSTPGPSGPAGAELEPFRSEIRMASVTFAYPNTVRPALEDVSLRIGKGETIGFVGPSGSGKSTLVDVLLGLLPPVTGKVLVDGADIALNVRSWQNQIGYVPQSIYLTDDTLRRNVAFGLADGDIDESAVARALRAAQLEVFVDTLPEGLETRVGERGVRLSGGQRQRIGIARALYHDPPVLVLDEATSSLDSTTERGVMDAVAALHGSKTIIIVAHRLSTVEQCDRLYRLEHGRVVAEGDLQVVTRAPVVA